MGAVGVEIALLPLKRRIAYTTAQAVTTEAKACVFCSDAIIAWFIYFLKIEIVQDHDKYTKIDKFKTNKIKHDDKFKTNDPSRIMKTITFKWCDVKAEQR